MTGSPTYLGLLLGDNFKYDLYFARQVRVPKSVNFPDGKSQFSNRKNFPDEVRELFLRQKNAYIVFVLPQKKDNVIVFVSKQKDP